jgi:uncharacterized membrane protein
MLVDFVGFHSVRAISAVVIAVVVLIFPAAAYGGTDDDDARGFVDSVGAFVFALAWPTATYERARFGSVEETDDGMDVYFRLHGKSAFGGGPLWVDVVLEIKNGKIADLRWGRHNGILAAPGETIKVMSEALAELNKQHAPAPATTPPVSSTGYIFKFTNGCRHPVRLSIRYLDTSGAWKSDGWWRFEPGETGNLSSDDGLLRSNNSFWYYYAETTNGSELEWRGTEKTKVGTREVPMRKAVDNEGDSEWSVTCN